jgi:hypothetical protein
MCFLFYLFFLYMRVEVVVENGYIPNKTVLLLFSSLDFFCSVPCTGAHSQHFIFCVTFNYRTNLNFSLEPITGKNVSPK